ncbi:heat shock transcription factor 4 [Lichtheimia corymbifera JMRC:FSU:9682]|uniref:Heat shock transcription factor 4 n=1 Tax=Lichtheimia corymbifera JMRC:FSU:9682 TaxID=1263082 RepID=A0A068S0A9_9FUNG|nr:heat shock transcription factor 4 [Lichtheimia corymbifera JMRC:FSU:9682]
MLHHDSPSLMDHEDDNGAGKPLPNFVKKLWMLVNNTSIDMLICWTNDGTGIWIVDAGEFSKSVLPCYFKHGNWQSFVRQLNLYGFRKVCNTYTSGGVGGNSSHQQSDGWHFRHSYFRKGAEHLLQYVKRKRGGGGGSGSGSGQFNMKFVPPYTVPIGVVTSSEPNPAISSTATIDHEGIIADDTRQNYAAVASNALQTRLQLIEDNLRDMESRNAHVCSNLLEMQRIQTHQNQALHNILAFVNSIPDAAASSNQDRLMHECERHASQLSRTKQGHISGSTGTCLFNHRYPRSTVKHPNDTQILSSPSSGVRDIKECLTTTLPSIATAIATGEQETLRLPPLFSTRRHVNNGIESNTYE